MRLLEFFESAYKEEITSSEIYSYIEEHTSSFKDVKMKLFLIDFNDYYYKKRINKLESLTDEEIIKKVQEYEYMYGSLPPDLQNRLNTRMYFGDDENTKTAVQIELIICEEITKKLFADRRLKCIDFEEIIYKDEFKGIIFLQDIINSILVKLDRDWIETRQQFFNKDEASENPQRIKPIKWLKSEEALRQLIDALKENGLIESRETDDIIEHFEVSGREAKQAELEPINWLKSGALLAYLNKELTMQPKQAEPFIDSKKMWVVLNLHFVINNKKIDRSLVGDVGQSRYPNGSDTIDAILRRLPAH